jgi:hypothetical protein
VLYYTNNVWIGYELNKATSFVVYIYSVKNIEQMSRASSVLLVAWLKTLDGFTPDAGVAGPDTAAGVNRSEYLHASATLTVDCLSWRRSESDPRDRGRARPGPRAQPAPSGLA